MAARPYSHIFSDASPKGLVYLCLVGGLLALAYGAVTQNWLFFAFVTFFPLAFIIAILVMKKPLWSYAMVAVTFCYFHAIYRYAHIPGLSGILDIMLGISLLSLVFNTINQNPEIKWKNAVNAVTVTYVIWMLYCLFSLLNPDTKFHNPITSRSVFTSFLIYLLPSVLMCTSKRLKVTLFLLGIFVLTAAAKALIQKYRWFDAAETRYLMETNSWTTHILSTGIRYFSFYSDAGNFGSSMGMFTLLFGLLAVIVRKPVFRISCLVVAAAACFGMLVSGTRGAIVVPFGGLLLYVFISRNLKMILTCILSGTLIFSFFYFTDIGEGNALINRMRTAFRPMEDASFMVRVNNQELMSYYLKDKPMGIGIGGLLMDEENLDGDGQRILPPDSFFVNVWIESGIVGLCLYIGILIFILLRCSYLLIFRIANDQLRQILAALLCCVFGLWLNGYVGRGMGAQPSQFLIALFLAFVLNGPYMDKLLKRNEILI